MVNQLNNNSVPWPSTIPQQMPWMNSYQPASIEMQFGQSYEQPVSQNSSITSLSSSSVTSSEQQQRSPFIAPASLNHIATTTSSIMPNNPFDPNSATQYFNNGAAIQGHSYKNQQFPTMPVTNSPPQVASQHHFSDSLTHISTSSPLSQAQLDTRSSFNHAFHQKRNSIEMEDDEQVKKEEPPTKQQLSENRLFTRFGSLHLDEEICDVSCLDDGDESDSSDDDKIPSNSYARGRREFSRYVYLLFKDKKTSRPLSPTNNAIDRLIREEREKLSKAVILWSPPPKVSFFDNTANDSDDEEDLKYSDHRDFLKSIETDHSITITEVTDELCDTEIVENNPTGADDVMIDD